MEVTYWKERYRRFIMTIPLLIVCFGMICGNLLLLYILCFTKFWYLPLLYIIWIFTLDKNTCDTGSRGFTWLKKNLPVPNLPFIIKSSSSYELDPKKNYLFCCFPHGIMPFGLLKPFVFEKGGFNELFPNHSPYLTTLHANYFIPCFREFMFAFNCVSASEKSLNYLLNDRNGAKAVALIVGGSDEIRYASQKDYHIVLKKRKGFARVALKNGSPIVPVFSFGCKSIYKFPQNSLYRRFSSWLELTFGWKFYIFYGQGIFQDWFGFTPLVKPIVTIAGEPISVVKNENPSREEVEELHKKFTVAVTDLFNENKHMYLPDADSIQLIIE